MMIKSQKW